MRALMLTITIVWAAVGPVACADSRTDRMEAAQQALLAWLDCIECLDGELDELLKYRDLIEDALIHTLQRGLSPARRAQIEEQLRSNYRSSPSQRIPEERYVQQFLARAVAGHQVRAAAALGELGTAKGRAALERAARGVEYAPLVREAAQRALAR